MLNRVPGPCLTIAHVFRPRRAPTWRPRTPCCQSDEGCVSDAKPASPHYLSGNELDPNLGATIPLATSAENDPRGSVPQSPFASSIQLPDYLYDCTNKMVLSTKMHRSRPLRPSAKPGPQDGPKSIILKDQSCNIL